MPCDFHSQADVLAHRQVRNERQLLEHHSDAATAGLGNVAVLHLRSVKKQSAFVGRKQTSYDLAEGRLPGSVLAEECMHLTGAEAGRNIVHRMRRTEALVNILEDDDFPRSGRWDLGHSQVVRHAFRRFPAFADLPGLPDQTFVPIARRSRQPTRRGGRLYRPATMPCCVPFVEPELYPDRGVRERIAAALAGGCAIDKNDAPDFDGPLFMVPVKPGALFSATKLTGTRQSTNRPAARRFLPRDSPCSSPW
jgi:hypothetical protein